MVLSDAEEMKKLNPAFNRNSFRWHLSLRRLIPEADKSSASKLVPD